MYWCVNFRSLQFGNQFIYQSMPRMLSLWLDFGAKAYDCDKGRMCSSTSPVPALLGPHSLLGLGNSAFQALNLSVMPKTRKGFK